MGSLNLVMHLLSQYTQRQTTVDSDTLSILGRITELPVLTHTHMETQQDMGTEHLALFSERAF